LGNRARAVLFDVDFTLIHPGPTFQGSGYRSFCARYGMAVDEARFEAAVASAAALLDNPDEAPYDDEMFIAYTRRIIEEMGGAGPAIDACAREIYAEWAACHHFELYDDVPGVLRELSAAGVRIGLVSNSHRSLDSFQSHFALEGLIAAAVSSSEYGRMKPHPSIFGAVLEQLGVAAPDAVMVGDSVPHDVEGALRAGMRAVLLHRAATPSEAAGALRARGVPVISSLTELPPLLFV
jgi:putative hydrolase of the HAD superfamily